MIRSWSGLSERNPECFNVAGVIGLCGREHQIGLRMSLPRETDFKMTITPAYRRPVRTRLVQNTLYGWSAPNTSLGLIVGALTLISGGRAQVREGTLEFHGGFTRWLLEQTPIQASAMTLGHVILGLDGVVLDLYRPHEQVHVRQAEIWGPFFLPAYLSASLWAWSTGRHIYLDNWFERDARTRSLLPWDTEFELLSRRSEI